jgi:hypothetical protein
VLCAKCHTQEGGKVEYAGTPKDCASCHEDAHRGQFVVGKTTACANCHKPASWRSLLFDHEKQSSFKLSGAHRTVPCGSCHKTEQSTRGSFIRFKPLNKTCESCHQGKT